MEMLLNLPVANNEHNNKLRPPSSSRRKRATLQNDIDRNLLDFAMNKSYTKKMAGHGKVNPDEVINTLADFILGFIPEEEVEQ